MHYELHQEVGPNRLSSYSFTSHISDKLEIH